MIINDFGGIIGLIGFWRFSNADLFWRSSLRRFKIWGKDKTRFVFKLFFNKFFELKPPFDFKRLFDLTNTFFLL